MILFLLGLFAGIIGGMGIGGGTILIPGLVFFTSLKQQTIQSINLLSFIPVAFIALFIHFKNKNVLLKFTIPIVVFGLLGAFVGSKIASITSSDLLRKLFGVFLLFMGCYELFFKKKS
ncbi:sulfite exporter TauE/SafE family protein [Serpentinicella sp. ANB-PHB4]|uniref:sulfite exporter TauE/SafE family protein n=1 Tax=Serpentinicella sp. ANB-PHB4 TaxID=3074076 RepID=UPI0028643438|nr:sulfite exporter TauE/SafE family protein [Serpentinicella sp. ANB-PHB4]MDR5657865.1 sulfite exporter TauE/SafE family protein [Serpentinicella sp. ANB-PHB4]